MLVFEYISLYWYLGHTRLHDLHNALLVFDSCLIHSFASYGFRSKQNETNGIMISNIWDIWTCSCLICEGHMKDI